MYLEVNKFTGAILSSERIAPLLNSDNTDVESYLNGTVYFDDVVLGVSDGVLRFMATPACPQTEIYYTESGDSLCFSDDFFEISNTITSPVVDETVVSFFLKKSYAQGGKTFIKGVSRLLSASLYTLRNGNFQHERILYSTTNQGVETSSFNIFKRKLEFVCSTEAMNKKVGVLFSGGADSLALALTLEKLKIPFVLYTGEILPAMKENVSDLTRSSDIARAKGWEHVIVRVNYNNFQFSDLHGIMDIMPNASHISLIFLEIMKKMKTDGVDVCFSGQNLDNLYNFGATAAIGFNRASVIDLARRFFLSEFYFSSFDRPWVAKIFRSMVSYMLLAGYCLMRRSFVFRLPQSRCELFHNFVNSGDNTVFSDTTISINVPPVKCTISSDSELRMQLVRSRVENYLSSGDSLSIINSAKLYGIKAVLPYSAEPLIPVFINLRTGLKDILIPKKMIHQIIKEHSDELPKFHTNIKQVLPGYHLWAENIFPSTGFAKSIKDVGECQKVKFTTPALKLSGLFSSSWKEYVVNKIIRGKESG